jgi:hypothetical protein
MMKATKTLVGTAGLLVEILTSHTKSMKRFTATSGYEVHPKDASQAIVN